MAFPDDYRRVQQAGGTQAQVESIAGLPRQILMDMTNLSPRLMDGILQGGYPFAMHHEIPELLQGAAGLEGEVDYVKDQVTNDPDNPKRFWRSSKLRQLFQMLADMTDINNWIVKDSAMPAGFRASAILISDMDAALVDGFYRFVPNTASNIPPGLAGTDQCMAAVIRQSSSELTQVVFSRAADGKMWIRSRVGGVFQAWTLATGVTAADLLLKVNKAGDTMTGKLTLPVSTNVLAQLNLRNGVFPASPVDGDIGRDDANGGIRFRKGGTTTKIVDGLATIRQPFAILQDQKPTNTYADPIIAGSWQARVLNTEYADADNIVSLSSNQFTLAAGAEYEVTVNTSTIVNPTAPFVLARLFNVTDGIPALSLNIRPSSNLNGNVEVPMIFTAILQGGKAYRIEQFVHTSAIHQFVNNNPGMPEIYLQVLIKRLNHVIV